MKWGCCQYDCSHGVTLTVTLMDKDLGENESKGPHGLLIHLP